MNSFSPSRILLILLLCLPCFIWAIPPAKTLKVVIIRHGEKPPNGRDLSCQGRNRAAALPAVLYQKFGKPDYAYVPDKNGKGRTTGSRMYQTILPFATQYKFSLDTKFDGNDPKGLAADILKKSGTVLVVWDHSSIRAIAKALGVADPGKWPGEDFDSIWVVSFESGSAVLKKDHEGLHPSTACK